MTYDKWVAEHWRYDDSAGKYLIDGLRYSVISAVELAEAFKAFNEAQTKEKK
jgi:hypothetical protein